MIRESPAGGLVIRNLRGRLEYKGKSEVAETALSKLGKGR
jgi:hypothetical protein